MTDQQCNCPDYTASRRAMLRNLALVGAGTVATSVFGDTFRQAAYGATGDGNVLIVLSLRGGADSLSMVVPHGESYYYEHRPRIAVPRGTLVAQDDSFGLHPQFEPLLPMWNAGTFGVVLATGLPQPNRSHFDAIEQIEDADPGSVARTGWINRMIGLDTLTSPLQAVNLGSGLEPASLMGPQSTLATETTNDIELAGGDDPTAKGWRRRALQQVWGKQPGPLGVGARASLATTAKLGPALRKQYQPQAAYPVTDLGDALKDTARLIKAKVGVKVVTLDYGSWDMHTNVGTLQSTGELTMKGMVRGFATGVAAFFKDLGPLASRVTLVTLTEFGRRVSQNGTGGLDHGWANATFAFGAGVKGGQFHGNWPGLGSGSLVDGDLKVTTDYRSVLTEILETRFASVSVPAVFPGFKPESVGLMRAS
ncbi:MAG TPA: DUF1501 domain-containing protein [Nocardioidaceae bacterium]|nr:DUF1501 domain-containing protein [Nocardioidaceae bacterium]